jgi:hypothetical protein
MPSNKLVVWIELRSGDQKFASALVSAPAVGGGEPGVTGAQGASTCCRNIASWNDEALGNSVSAGVQEMIVRTILRRVSDTSSRWHAASCEAVIVRSGGSAVSHRDGRQCGQRAANTQPDTDIAT